MCVTGLERDGLERRKRENTHSLPDIRETTSPPLHQRTGLYWGSLLESVCVCVQLCMFKCLSSIVVILKEGEQERREDYQRQGVNGWLRTHPTNPLLLPPPLTFSFCPTQYKNNTSLSVSLALQV